MRADARRRQRGASLFELAVCAGVFAILAAVLLDRVQRYQAEAEHADVTRQVATLRSLLLVRVLQAEIAGDAAAVAALVGSNPMALLQTPPASYRGEFDKPDEQALAPGSWYFDRKQQKLVYLFTGKKSFHTGTPTQWAFTIKFTRLPTNNAKPPGTQPLVGSVALTQVDG
ncbi:type II secretion system protein [Pseudoduganella buxea]|uniref:Type II secretion system protein n=1 Tax=Pseudoduganella buxea TaxID=1949069 RepID=A0A6I3T1P5_9BURK|nr:hypothetical protein [Pseudoduganella buxea]MTV54392.1 hypothetical protein [Pseudoduganella buxea]GGC10982.1 hypothetical protein GCM10011572_35400 [Pseudoduganella buxea]